MTAVGFEPTPFRTSALSWRLRPLGQAICITLRIQYVVFASRRRIKKKQKLTAVGFEPTRIAPPELESGALDRSAKLSWITSKLAPFTEE